MAVSNVFLLNCDECDKHEQHPMDVPAVGWLQLIDNGVSEKHFCSTRCLIMHLISGHLADAPHDHVH